MAGAAKFIPYIPTIINGSLLLVLIGGLIQVNAKAESMIAQQGYAVPEIRALRKTVGELVVTVAEMKPLLKILSEKKIPPADVERRLDVLEQRVNRIEYGIVKKN